MADATNNMQTVRPKRLAEIIDLSMETDIPLMIWGPPGVGKTSIVEQRAEAAGLRCLTVALTLFDPVDLNS